MLVVSDAIKLKPKACDTSLTSFYCDHTDFTSTGQIQQENKSRPGNFFAGIMPRDPIWPDQRNDTKNAFTRIPAPMGRLLQQAQTCCVAGSSPCALAPGSEEWMGGTAHSTGVHHLNDTGHGGEAVGESPGLGQTQEQERAASRSICVQVLTGTALQELGSGAPAQLTPEGTGRTWNLGRKS
ncbi:hypothetical protein DV515_00013334 [Chloebia gouldiae]|uniref:Uncharacterized protein n=1 Tax=Chloebia gouldiae TaxID=44316 RepID=A0A3L8S1D5_CHLGU|nr:hypothetical protein DV515_00013334 [Chloebia gouldiae]